MTLSFTQRIFVEPMTNVQANITCNIYIQPSLKAELPISLQQQCNDNNNNDNDDDDDNPTLPNVGYIILKLSHVSTFPENDVEMILKTFQQQLTTIQKPRTHVQYYMYIKVHQRYTEPKEKSRQNKQAKIKIKIEKKRKQQQIINAGDVAIRYWIISQFRLVLACQLNWQSAAPVPQRSRVRIPYKPDFFFRFSFRNCKSCVCNCDDHPSFYNSSLRSSRI